MSMRSPRRSEKGGGWIGVGIVFLMLSGIFLIMWMTTSSSQGHDVSCGNQQMTQGEYCQYTDTQTGLSGTTSYDVNANLQQSLDNQHMDTDMSGVLWCGGIGLVCLFIGLIRRSMNT